MHEASASLGPMSLSSSFSLMGSPMLIGQKWISIAVSGDSVVRIGETHPSHIAVIEERKRCG